MFDAIVSDVVIALEAVGALVITGAAVAAVVLIAAGLVRFRRLSWRGSRGTLGRGLVLGLDFLIAADILRTMVTPTLDEAAVLAVIIVLRTILSLTIEFELRRMTEDARDENR